MQPTDKDLAEFALLALEFKLIGLPQIVAWGDKVIEARDDPPTWALDLSMAQDVESVNTILNQMQWERGTLTPYLAQKMLFHLTYKKWKSSELHWQDIRLIFWDGRLSPDKKSASELHDFEILSGTILALWEELDGGFITEPEIVTVVNNYFQSYDPSSTPLPSWV